VKKQVFVAFVLGACTTAATQSIASTTEPAPVGAVIVNAQAERRQAPNGKAWVTILARGNNAFLGKLEMEPGAEVPEHRDPTEEYIHVLEGSGRMVIDGKEHAVAAGTTIFMPPNALVTYLNGPERLVALQVFAGPDPASKYDSWKKL
jgi:quercetin dioxygenase-like cupin family protein